jgi:hypothetical protein
MPVRSEEASATSEPVAETRTASAPEGVNTAVLEELAANLGDALPELIELFFNG